MSRQVLGKRPRSQSPSRSPLPPGPKTRRSTRGRPLPLPSPDSTPNPKRVKRTCTAPAHDDGSNKENIPPDSVFASPASMHAPDSTSDAPPVTPRAIRATRRRASHAPPVTPQATRAAAAATPSSAIARLSLNTPPPTPTSTSPPASTQTLASTSDASPVTPQSILESRRGASPPPTPVFTPPSLHAQARALLHPQAHDTAPLVDRDAERDVIRAFLASDADGTSLYISGAPGTGKTALVSEVLADVEGVRVVYVNCMALGGDGLAGVWERCAEDLDAAKQPKCVKTDWSVRFSRLLQDHKCILVLDEVDHLTTSISQVFALATSALRIIGISNTHTLTHTPMPGTGTRTLHFAPYTASQMKAVLGARLASTPAAALFPPATLALLTMRIAGQTGDLRTVFAVARRALELSSSAATPTVTPAHILAALKTHCTGPSKSSGAETVTRVRNLGLHARFALAALLLATRRTAAGLVLTSSGALKENAHAAPTRVSTIDVTALHGFYAALLARGTAAFVGVSRTEFGDLVSVLEGSGLVTVEAGGRGRGGKGKGGIKVVTGVREEELVRGLVGGEGSGLDVDVKEEEVRCVWEREVGRIARETSARKKSAEKRVTDEFEGAEEG